MIWRLSKCSISLNDSILSFQKRYDEKGGVGYGVAQHEKQTLIDDNSSKKIDWLYWFRRLFSCVKMILISNTINIKARSFRFDFKTFHTITHFAQTSTDNFTSNLQLTSTTNYQHPKQNIGKNVFSMTTRLRQLQTQNVKTLLTDCMTKYLHTWQFWSGRMIHKKCCNFNLTT